MSERGIAGLGLWVILAAAGLLTFVTLYDKAFPTASVDLKVRREQAQARAAEYLKARGFALSGYEQATVFEADDAAAVYLEKTQGMERANELMRREVPVWYWACRWFKPLQKEEYRVLVSPAGEIIGFRQELEEERAGAKLAAAAAQAIAEKFLQEVVGVRLEEYELVDSSSEQEKNRTDHNFVWKKTGFQVGEGELRLRVGVWGDYVGNLRYFFKVPEAFERDYQRQSAQGTLLGIVSVAFTIIFFVLALVVFVQRYKVGDIRWRFALAFAIVLLVLMLAGAVNSFPLLKSEYPTSQNYGVYLGVVVVAVVIVSLVYGVFILLTGASGEALTRELRVESVQPLHELLAGRVATPEFARAAGLGYLAAFVMVGYFTAFYFIGRRFFGVWLPAESPYSNMLNTALPFLFPLLVGFTAAVSEEFTYRFFAIPFLRKYVKKMFLALLIPAVIWGFAHSTYPVFPVYVRGIEVTLVGLLFGWLYLRYDILTCIVAHYAVDALFVGLPLLRSENTYFRVSGVIVAFLGLLPLLPALVVWLRRKPQMPAG